MGEAEDLLCFLPWARHLGGPRGALGSEGTLALSLTWRGQHGAWGVVEFSLSHACLC